MSRLTILDDIQIASPCEARWDEMAGDDRARFCPSCSKHVYNLTAMTASEATDLIVEHEGRVCLRIFQRFDGTVLTADCPVGRAKLGAGRRARRLLAMGLVLPALAVAGVAAQGFGPQRIEPFPTGPGVTWDDRIHWALVTLGLRNPSPPPLLMGKMTLGGIRPIMGEPAAFPAAIGSPAPPAAPANVPDVCGDEPATEAP